MTELKISVVHVNLKRDLMKSHDATCTENMCERDLNIELNLIMESMYVQVKVSHVAVKTSAFCNAQQFGFNDYNVSKVEDFNNCEKITS